MVEKTLDEILGIEFPFIQGGMANVATGAFAAACSNAGAMGLIAGGGLNGEQLRAEIASARSLTDKPFGVNLMLMNPFIDELVEVVCDEKIGFITTGAGDPGKYMDQFKAAGAKVFPVIPSVALARRVVERGADGVIAEGTESGGHVGEATTMSLVYQVAQAVDVPVVAAGGIGSGAQYLAVRALGACGAQLGTCLLVSEECPVHENYKQQIISASDTGTIVTGRSLGAPVRVIKNRMAREYVKMEKEGASRDELEELTLGSLRRAVSDGDVKTGSCMAGQIAGQLTEIRPLRVILEEIYTDSFKVLGELSSEAAAKGGEA